MSVEDTVDTESFGYPCVHAGMVFGEERVGVDVPPDTHEHPVDPNRVAQAGPRGISAEDASRLAGTTSLFVDPVRAQDPHGLDLSEELCR